MRARIASLMAATWVAFGGMAAADGPVVVELYTSQGCSSCPPADKLFGEIADRDDIIALALHVDYWDYIGWKDSFANPAFTQRQRAYARAAGTRTIYTPQIVVEGQDHVIGTKPMKLADRINAHTRIEDPIEVVLSRSGGTLRIQAEAQGRTTTSLVVQVVTYVPEATVDIRRGENAGRKLTYNNIVRDWMDVGRWDGSGVYQADVRIPANLPAAVLVQESNAGRILGAAKIN